MEDDVVLDAIRVQPCNGSHDSGADSGGRQQFHTVHYSTYNTSWIVSAAESRAVRVLCLTYTYEAHHQYVDAIRSTWGKRCDGY